MVMLDFSPKANYFCQNLVLRSIFALTLLISFTFSNAQNFPPVEEVVENSSSMEGYFNLYWGRIRGQDVLGDR